MKRFLLLILIIITSSGVYPNDPKTIQISLLTVPPRDAEIYTVYGHSALRLQYNKTDAVLNWGTFDVDRKNFIINFIQGKTDYFLSAQPYTTFQQNYLDNNTQIIEQQLNIPDSLKIPLLRELKTNLLPENAEYRYNYFFDNCTTRPRNIIERYCGGTLSYPPQNERITLRDLVHKCTSPYPWMRFGIDLLIGSGADSLISRRTELFLPENLCLALAQSTVLTPDGRQLPIILSTEKIMHRQEAQKHEKYSKKKHQPSLTEPLHVSILALFVFLITATWAIAKRRTVRLPFAILFLVMGVAGCIPAFLMLFSSHPCVSSNWNILWLNPLHLICFAGFATTKKCRLIDLCFVLNFVALSVFIVARQWIPQTTDPACLPLAICLWLGILTKICVGRPRKPLPYPYIRKIWRNTENAV
ncbi:MAG: DUF4105 domain-containing protein [Dysgonamonadaceae bacterium]|jgi:hypothetical protein|nr:DUF4105 domain-containing protein [Dysgonamonadaceae bacterium]